MILFVLFMLAWACAFVRYVARLTPPVPSADPHTLATLTAARLTAEPNPTQHPEVSPMPIAIGTSLNVDRPVDPYALAGWVSPGDVILADGKRAIVLGVTVHEPGQHPNSPVKPHLSAVEVRTTHTTVWIGARTVKPANDEGDTFWDRQPAGTPERSAAWAALARGRKVSA